MVVDHAHINYSPEHCKPLIIVGICGPYRRLASAAISATVASGIRSYFCYSAIPQSRVISWAPLELEPPSTTEPDWAVNQFTALAAKQPWGNGRVSLGLAFDSFYLPKDDVVALFNKTRSMGLKLITSHYVGNAILRESIFPVVGEQYSPV